jgi:hypothetical protein
MSVNTNLDLKKIILIENLTLCILVGQHSYNISSNYIQKVIDNNLNPEIIIRTKHTVNILLNTKK